MRIRFSAGTFTRIVFQSILIALLFLCLPSGCSEKRQSGREVGKQAALEWPEFERLEALLFETVELSDAGNGVEVLLRRGKLVEAGWAVNLRTLPPEANDCETLRHLLGDLVSKVNRLAVPEIDSSIMREVISGMKPIVAEIGLASHVRGS